MWLGALAEPVGQGAVAYEGLAGGGKQSFCESYVCQVRAC